MKTINTYINEKLRLTAKRQYTCQPKDKDELKSIIIERIKKYGNECDLNDIDTSKITDMSRLFAAYVNEIFDNFNGDISQWDVSNVKYMLEMFRGCEQFDCDLSMWNVSNVEHMYYMFGGCKEFNCNLSMWDVSNVKDMGGMFRDCKKFNSDISMWNVSNVTYMNAMFNGCKKFKQDLDSWDVSKVKGTEFEFEFTFKGCPTKPNWDIK